LLFAAASVVAGRDGTPDMLAPMRAVSVVFSTVGLFVLGLASPLAAALIAFHTLVVTYTSEAYLESIPFAASAAAVILLQRSAAPLDGWCWASAPEVGVAAAGKWLICLVVVPDLVYVLVVDSWPRWRGVSDTAGARVRWRGVLPYFVLAAAMTVVLVV